MLSELLSLLEQNQGQIHIQELSQRLDIPPSVLAGMIQLLVQKGRLVEVNLTCGLCETCALRATCDPGAVRAKNYRVQSPAFHATK